LCLCALVVGILVSPFLENMMSQFQPIPPETEEIARLVVDAAFAVHKNLGPGLLESVYEVCLCHELKKRGVPYRNQVSLPVIYDGERLDAGLRLDVLADESVIVELKAVEKHNPLFEAQLLTYLKLTGHRLGFLINFNVAMIKDGIKRMVV
jgi:GxxExxY protein